VAFNVNVSPEAKDDMIGIYRYVAEADSTANADRLLAQLEDACDGLAGFPERGNRPKELLRLGVAGYRDAHLGPYRIVYAIKGRTVVILCVADGRRDMQTLLQKRLLQ
jgi:toxin ParE1/3/4